MFEDHCPFDSCVWNTTSIYSILYCRSVRSLMARFKGTAWGPSGADRTQVGPMLAPWTLPSGIDCMHISSIVLEKKNNVQTCAAFLFVCLWLVATGESSNELHPVLWVKIIYHSQWENICAWGFNSLRLRQNWWHIANDIFKCIFLNENCCIFKLIRISLKYVSKGPTNNILASVHIMAWCWLGDKPLSEPMMA